VQLALPPAPRVVLPAAEVLGRVEKSVERRRRDDQRIATPDLSHRSHALAPLSRLLGV